MKRWTIHILLCVGLSIVCTAATAEEDDYEVQGWQRVFTDEFQTIDNNDWTLLNRQYSFNNEKQFYRPEQVSITPIEPGNNALRLTATNQRLADRDYRSGLVRSKHEWSYGRFEVRADLPTSQGMWPAIWLLPDDSIPWPTGGEIDIMENRGSEPHTTSSAYHWQSDPRIPCCSQHRFVYDEYSAVDEQNQPINFHEGFHTYAVEWEPDVLRFYVDGNRHYTVEATASRPIFDTAKSMILNLAVGGNFGGDPNGTTVWPQHFDIDYVRVWQRENGFFGLVNSGFDENGGSLNSWESFNDDGANLEVVQGASVTGDSAIRIAAQPGGNSFAGIFQGVNVDGGETLRLRARTLIPDGQAFNAGSSVQAKVEFYTEFGGGYNSAAYLGEEILTIAEAGFATGDWQENLFVVDAPNNAVEARVTFIVSEGGSPTGTVLVDGVSLVAVEGLAGDFNFDGRVDAIDFTVWKDTEGSSTNLAADANRDGTVDDADAAIWRANFGRTGANNSTSIPEPTAAVLGAMVVLQSLSRR
ncbi:MAG: family 16 glycosylhydrolase [Planctomycetota bacterium]